LTKRKKYNSSAFTLLELLVVIIVIGIIVATLSFDFSPNKLQLAADQLIKDIRFTQSLALKDDKYQPFPSDNSYKENQRSKYWFKQWWQLKFILQTDGSLVYMIFSDKPANGSTNNFDTQIIKGSLSYEVAKDSNGKYIYGGDTYLSSGEKPNQDYNLSKFGIKKVVLVSEYGDKSNGYIKLLFDNFGNVFLSEGKSGDSGDINPFEYRNILTKNAILYLCLNRNCDKNTSIIITPSGEIISKQ
jgi:prepilin-type N-terminal cleavage/methylation domain-containing protein